MKKKLFQVFDYLYNGNFLTQTHMQKIYGDNVTEEEKQEFVQWCEANNIGLCPQPSRGIFLFADKTTGEILDYMQLRKLFPSEYKPKNTVFKSFENINTITCNYKDVDYPSGWLTPSGKLIESDWGEHEDTAFKIVENKNLKDELKTFKKEYNSIYARDYLVEKLNYILLDCPSNSLCLSITHPNRITKAQRIWLENYLIKIQDMETLNRILRSA